MKLRDASPTGAFSDLRLFLRTRKRHEWWFAVLSLLIVCGILWAFWKDSQFERPYKREIIYAESWPLNRSDEEIKAQQAIDLPKEKARKAEFERKLEERRLEFEKVNNTLESWGL